MVECDFANILFAGPCNRRCPYCIGRLLPERVNISNLDAFPLAGLDPFIAEVNRRGIRQLVFTGTVTDPQLYRHEARLLALLRERVTTGPQVSLHTNGALALEKLDVFDRYDRACISFPSFEPSTYEKHMGSRQVPPLAEILRHARIPVKVSCVVNEHNLPELPEFLERCRAIGVRRLVLRRLYGETRAWKIPSVLERRGEYRGNPVYALGEMEVAWWDFAAAQSTSINLFADGTVGTSYLLARTPELSNTAA